MAWEKIVSQPDVDAVIISTTHNSLATISKACIESGKHVLVDKPAARSAKELEPVIAAWREKRVKVRVGFNHRYHPAIQEAKRLIDQNAIGPLMFIRGRYGHGGRLNYEKEWRADPELAGGGELLDQGMHLIDLSRWFLGEFPHVLGRVHTYFWQMPVEDNGFMMLETAKHQTAWLHVSWTEWKNMFSLEIYGKDGKLQIDGLGGSYGVEQLTYFKMLPQMGPPETTTWQYPGEDQSWQEEIDEFAKDIREDRDCSPGLNDAHQALTVIEKIYAQSRVLR
jgi:predicted dehydrogenase